MMSWSMLLLGILLMTAAIQDSVEQQKEEEEIHNIVAAGRGPPMNVAVMPVLATALNVSWDPPEEEPYYYMVDIGLNTDVTFNTFYLQEGLQGCTDYSITVTSVYADTCEDCAAHTQGITGISVPPPPQKCWFDVTDATYITAYWSDPSIQCSITNHNISWWSHVLWNDEEGSGNAHATGDHYLIRNLQPYTNVTVSVAAATDIGYGLPTTCWNVTLQDNPGPPVILEVLAYVGHVVVYWTPPDEVNGIITEYMINAVSEENSVSTSVAGTVLTSVVDLQESQFYDITVQARTEAGWGPKSEVWSIYFCGTFPPAPELCWFSNITDNKMVINWIDPFVQCANNHSISWAWDVLWSDEQGSNVTFSQHTSITLTDLPPYTNVTAQVAAAAAGGFGPPTSCWNVTSPDKMSGTKAMPDVVVMEEQLTQTDITKPESPEHDMCETDVHTAP